jgi:hypothetical protein
MIRAGRRDLVRTMADLAEARGVSLGTFRNTKPHTAVGHPAPISSPGTRVLLWDGEQVDAFNDPETREIPKLPTQDSDEDLLDRNEAAASRGVSSKTWDGYKVAPQLQATVVVVGGVEHWPRAAVKAFAPAGKQKPSGRPKGAGDLVPRDELPARVGELVHDNPTITGSQVSDTLGVHVKTAQLALIEARGRRIADLIEADPELTAADAARQLGYPAAVTRSAAAAAGTELRMRQALPYLESVCSALLAVGIELQGTPPNLQVLDAGVCAATVVLAAGGPVPVPAMVWDERWGWRTATRRLHPIGADHTTPPQGEGIRYLAGGITPEPAELLAWLRDGRTGSKKPSEASIDN